MTTRTVKRTTKTVILENPLVDLIPDPSEAAEGRYVSRYIEGYRDLDLLRYAHTERNHVLMFGDTGGGKTSMFTAYAASMGIPLVTVMCNGGIDPNSFWGQPGLDMETGKPRFNYSDITEVIRHGGMINFDEINFTPPKTLSVIHSLLDRRRYITILENHNERIKAHDDLFIVASMNLKYHGTRPLNEALKNRFHMHLPLGYDEEVEGKLLGFEESLIIGAKLRASRENGVIDTPISTNMLQQFEIYAMDLGLDFAIANFLGIFDAEERPAVQVVFEMHKTHLEEQRAELIARAEAAAKA